MQILAVETLIEETNNNIFYHLSIWHKLLIIKLNCTKVEITVYI